MATTNIIPGSFYITTSTDISGDVITHSSNEAVEIHSAKIDYDIDNRISDLPTPVPKGDVGTKTPTSRILDYKRLKRGISVQGALSDDAGESANTKRNNLINMVESKRGLVALWGPSGNYRTLFGDTATTKVFISKLGFTETSGTYGESVVGDPQPRRKIDVTLTLIIGKDV